VRIETLRYVLTRDRQDALRQRLRELAAVRLRFGHRRLTMLLKRHFVAMSESRASLPDLRLNNCKLQLIFRVRSWG